MTFTSKWRHMLHGITRTLKLRFSALWWRHHFLKVSIMTQIDINVCILLFYIFLRNLMAFDKELVILHGFFNLRISKKELPLYPSRKKHRWSQNIFFFFAWFYIKMHIILYKTAEFYFLNQSRSILLVPPKYTLEN